MQREGENGKKRRRKEVVSVPLSDYIHCWTLRQTSSFSFKSSSHTVREPTSLSIWFKPKHDAVQALLENTRLLCVNLACFASKAGTTKAGSRDIMVEVSSTHQNQRWTTIQDRQDVDVHFSDTPGFRIWIDSQMALLCDISIHLPVTKAERCAGALRGTTISNSLDVTKEFFQQQNLPADRRKTASATPHRGTSNWRLQVWDYRALVLAERLRVFQQNTWLHTAPKQRATQQLDHEECGHGEGCYPRVRVPGHTNDISWRSRVCPASETVGCRLIGLWVTTGNRRQADEGRDALNKQEIAHFYFPCNSWSNHSGSFIWWAREDQKRRDTGDLVNCFNSEDRRNNSNASEIRQYLCNLRPKGCDTDKQELVGACFDVRHGDGDDMFIWEALNTIAWQRRQLNNVRITLAMLTNKGVIKTTLSKEKATKKYVRDLNGRLEAIVDKVSDRLWQIPKVRNMLFSSGDELIHAFFQEGHSLFYIMLSTTIETAET